MATALAAEPQLETPREPKRQTRRVANGRRRAAAVDPGTTQTRYFIGKADGKAPSLERELGTEKEAMVESLRSGQSYFAITEWRAVADISKDVPMIRKEIVSPARSGPKDS
jgi:hypothetical protein